MCKAIGERHRMFSFSKDAHLGHLTAVVFCCCEEGKIFNSNILEWNTAYFSYRWQKNIYVKKFPSTPVPDTGRDVGGCQIARFRLESQERVMVILPKIAAPPLSPLPPGLLRLAGLWSPDYRYTALGDLRNMAVPAQHCWKVKGEGGHAQLLYHWASVAIPGPGEL